MYQKEQKKQKRFSTKKTKQNSAKNSIGDFGKKNPHRVFGEKNPYGGSKWGWAVSVGGVYKIIRQLST